MNQMSHFTVERALLKAKDKTTLGQSALQTAKSVDKIFDTHKRMLIEFLNYANQVNVGDVGDVPRTLWDISGNKLEYIEKYAGGNADVHHVQINGMAMMIKVQFSTQFDTRPKRADKQTKEPYLQHQCLRHFNYFPAYYVHHKYYSIMEYTGKDLKIQKMHTQLAGEVNKKKRLALISQLFDPVIKLGEYSLVHGDLKWDNYTRKVEAIGANTTSCATLIDFDTLTRRGMTMSKQCTHKYATPERLNKNAQNIAYHITEKDDCFALGVMMAEARAGKGSTYVDFLEEIIDSAALKNELTKNIGRPGSTEHTKTHKQNIETFKNYCDLPENKEDVELQVILRLLNATAPAPSSDAPSLLIHCKQLIHQYLSTL
ncbi:MAG TPA: hypothetical protein EYO59_12240 [Chromatiaceae bacterium]|nr:hypothetical protein [Chromatiaceae bacterium]